MLATNDQVIERLRIRDLAHRGILSEYVKTLNRGQRRLLRIEAYGLIWPVVFQNLTRRMEMKRGHHLCARSVQDLRPECLDRFHDDMDAVLDDLFRNAKVPIVNLEGWATRRMTAATIDAYRRRRSERGALQRPRLPGWLAEALHHDSRLMALAVEMLEWVGVESCAGASVWPLRTWAQQRAVGSRDHDAAMRSLTADVETVLRAMRRRPTWYEDYVERPLGRKPAPVLPGPEPDSDRTPKPSDVEQAEQDRAEDTHLASIAEVAIAAIRARVARGEEPRDAVVDVLRRAFTASTGVEDMDRRPNRGFDAHEIVAARLADPASIDRIVAEVLMPLPVPAYAR